MGKISVFNYLSVDGYFAGPNGEIDWFKDIPEDKEYADYTHKASQSGTTLMFGRTTYEMMKSFWPTDEAKKMEPEMAEVMNNSPKIVFSKSMAPVIDEPNWKNVTVVHELNKGTIEKLKQEHPDGITILGSGTIVQQLTNFGFIEFYSLVTAPLVLGRGKLLFKDVKQLQLELSESKRFKNGVVMNNYKRAV